MVADSPIVYFGSSKALLTMAFKQGTTRDTGTQGTTGKAEHKHHEHTQERAEHHSKGYRDQERSTLRQNV